jgi:hypothetical protein
MTSMIKTSSRFVLVLVLGLAAFTAVTTNSGFSASGPSSKYRPYELKLWWYSEDREREESLSAEEKRINAEYRAQREKDNRFKRESHELHDLKNRTSEPQKIDPKGLELKPP